jgi:hypothetical protein
VPGFASSTDIEIQCSETVCKVVYAVLRITAATAVIGPESQFGEFVTAPPVDGLLDFSVHGLDSPLNEYEVTLTIRSSPRPPPTEQEIAAENIRLASIARGIARNYLPSNSYTEAAVVFGTREGFDTVVENVCSLDCPLDVRRLIYFDVPDSTTCARLSGNEETIVARDRDGGFSERTFSVPGFLPSN